MLRTRAARRLFDRTLDEPAALAPIETDTGVVQIDSLRLDAAETIRRADAFHGTLARRAEDDARALRAAGVRLVVGDVPPLAFAAAALAGVPSIALANFTWDWIYEGYPDELADAPNLVPAIRAAYSQATEAWRLPFWGGFAAFGAVRDVPLIARHARRAPADTRATLGLPAGRPLVLVSFGGYGAGGLGPASLDCLDRYGVVTTTPDDDAGAPPAPGVFPIAESVLYARGLRYEDLVAAVDVVLTKPGYGIVSECIANDTAIAYTSRGHFVEYDVLVRAMPRVLRCGFIDHAALFAGRWGAVLDAIAAQPAPPERPGTDGAAVAAECLLGLMG
jgi:L-arabinokinase